MNARVPSDRAPVEVALARPTTRQRHGSVFVASGILLSRLFGLLRESVMAAFFGTTIYGDVVRASLRMPNVLQNLLGEGTLSASFIPVYSELLAQGRKEEAGRLAGAVFALLLAVAGAIAALGALLAPLLTTIFLPGFTGERRELTIAAARWIFPMTGVLVLSAWALGILNSRRRFFLPYVAPVLWNAAMIATLLFFGGILPPRDLVLAFAIGALVGGMLQFAVQLPWVLRLEPHLRVRWDLRNEAVRTVVRNATPAIAGRGMVQISGYVDQVLASLLAAGAVAALGYALTLYLLPVSLFGMSVAAAELPELSRQRLGDLDALRRRASEGITRIAFFAVPAFVAYITLPDVIVATLFQRGEFNRGSTLLVAATLAGLALGLIPSTTTRLFSSTFFALQDPRTPARAATVRVLVSALLGFLLMILLEPIRIGARTFDFAVLGDLRVAGQPLGIVGLVLGASAAAWTEWGLLHRGLRRRIGPVQFRPGAMTRLLGAAALAAIAARLLHFVAGAAPELIRNLATLAAFGAVYLGAAAAFGVEEVAAQWRRWRRP